MINKRFWSNHFGGTRCSTWRNRVLW